MYAVTLNDVCHWKDGIMAHTDY